MSDDTESSALPVSWDEGARGPYRRSSRLRSAADARPLSGFIDERWGVFSDDLAELTRNASPTTGLMVIGAAVLVATTPQVDLVPSLRTATVVIAWVVTLQAGAAIVLDLWRVSVRGARTPRTDLRSLAPGPVAGRHRSLAGVEGCSVQRLMTTVAERPLQREDTSESGWKSSSIPSNRAVRR